MRKIKKNQFRRFIEFIETKMIFSKYFIIVILLSIVFRLSVILIALYCKSYMYVSCNFYSLFRLDALHYLSIAEHGYNKHNIVFFPFYPFLIRIFNITLNNSYVSSLIISNMFFLLDLLVLLLIINIAYKNTILREARNFIIFLSLFSFVLFPTSFFTSLAFTESTFIFFSWLTLLFVIKNSNVYASIFSFLASLTRINGIFHLPLAFLIKTINGRLLFLFFTLFSIVIYTLYLHIASLSNFYIFEFFQLQKDFSGRRVLDIMFLGKEIIFWIKEPITYQSLPAKFWFNLSSIFLLFIYPFLFIFTYFKLRKFFNYECFKAIFLYSIFQYLFVVFSGALGSTLRYSLSILLFYLVFPLIFYRHKNLAVIFLIVLYVIQVYFFILYLKDIVV
jgi:Gpi18-like mannosyltransferase